MLLRSSREDEGLMKVLFLVQKEQLARAQRQRRLPLQTVDSLAAAHVHDLHIIVAVRRKAGKARVRAQRDELALGKQLLAVDDKAAAGAVQALVHFFAGQQAFLFLCHAPQAAQYVFPQGTSPFPIAPAVQAPG